jgi:TRAP-type mannitol/chloroaromatic compound transport system permease small subunit
LLYRLEGEIRQRRIIVIATSEKPGITGRLECFILAAGRFVCWVNVVLILVIVLQVALRYIFGRGLVLLEELEWHLYATGFLFGLSYTITADSNVRMDLFHSRFSRKTKEWIEILGLLFLLLPFIAVMFMHSLDFVQQSWVMNERSDAPLGLPWRWLIKSVIPVSFLMVMVAALARVSRAVKHIRR